MGVLVLIEQLIEVGHLPKRSAKTQPWKKLVATACAPANSAANPNNVAGLVIVSAKVERTARTRDGVAASRQGVPLLSRSLDTSVLKI